MAYLKDDLTGKKFHKMEVIGKSDIRKKGRRETYWICRCECGIEKIFETSIVNKGKIKSCGCIRTYTNKKNQKFKDLSGLIFHKLKILDLDHTEGNGKKKRFYWLCECDCGGKIVVEGGRFRRDKTPSCGCDIKNIEEIAPKMIYLSYKFAAKARNREFKVSKTFLSQIILENCYYCGDRPKNRFFYKHGKTKEFYYSGIDRVNNDIGYLENNCIPCCFICNKSKNKLSKNIFLLQVDKIYKNNIDKIDLNNIKIFDEKSRFPQRIWYTYQKNAKDKKIPFDLSKEDFHLLLSQNCFYCGIEPQVEYWKRKFKYGGIDRIDNNLHYTKDNCVPCCKTCNYMKSYFTTEDFKSMIIKIYKNLIENKLNDK